MTKEQKKAEILRCFDAMDDFAQEYLFRHSKSLTELRPAKRSSKPDLRIIYSTGQAGPKLSR